MKYDYDLYVIGAGSGGVRASRMAAQFGAKVVVAESTFLGGTCVNVGCIPKKLFVYGSHYHEDFEDARSYGWNNKVEKFDWPTLRDNKTKEIERLNGVYANLLDNAGVETHNGRATLTGPNTVEINNRQHTAKNILIATGGTPTVPDFPGNDLVITSNEAFYLPELPQQIVIVGGGYIAVEFAGIFAGLGVETTLIYRGDLFLRGFDISIREFVKEEILNKNINIVFNTNVSSIRSNEHRRELSLSNGSNISADLVLYATGRKPNTDNLGLERAGVDLGDRGQILVDERYQTSQSSVLAIGDVTDRVQLTPVAIEEGMYIANSLFGDTSYPLLSYDNIPTAVFCQPNIGTVGLTEDEVISKYSGDIDIYESQFKPMKHTMTGREEHSYMKMIVQRSTDTVLGIHMVGNDAGELVQGLAVALTAGATKRQFDKTIGIHPTAAEEFVTLRQVSRSV